MEMEAVKSNIFPVTSFKDEDEEHHKPDWTLLEKEDYSSEIFSEHNNLVSLIPNNFPSDEKDSSADEDFSAILQEEHPSYSNSSGSSVVENVDLGVILVPSPLDIAKNDFSDNSESSNGDFESVPLSDFGEEVTDSVSLSSHVEQPESISNEDEVDHSFPESKNNLPSDNITPSDLIEAIDLEKLQRGIEGNHTKVPETLNDDSIIEKTETDTALSKKSDFGRMENGAENLKAIQVLA